MKSQTRSLSRLAVFLLIAATTLAAWLAPLAAIAGPSALEPPSQTIVDEARLLVEKMKASDRGPYKHIRWFCNDGEVFPPEPYACREHGGGRQHGVLSEDAVRLGQLGWPVGTIFAAMSFEELFDSDNRNQRLRVLPVEKYLIDVADGWVLAKARFYRGRIQVEDEEAAGTALLSEMLSEKDWLRENFLLAREAVRTIPHGAGEDRTRTVRNLAQALADQDRAFSALRTKIHTAPDAGDAGRVRQWAKAAEKRGAPPELLAKAEELGAALDQLFGELGRRERIDQLAKKAGKLLRGAEAAKLLALAKGADDKAKVQHLSALLALLRDMATASTNGSANLTLMDISLATEEELRLAALAELRIDDASRADVLLLSNQLVSAVYGCGFITGEERAAVAEILNELLRESQVSAEVYLEAARALKRVGPWAAGAARFSFAEALVRFSALEPKAEIFSDDLLRASPLLPLAEASRLLSLDAEALAGVSHGIFGVEFSGILGLNPGLAVGRLRIATEDELQKGGRFGRDEIVVLPRTVSELEPVAGILTLAEGNLLSHVQLLARNLGIPNASLIPTLSKSLSSHAGERVVLAVGTDGSVTFEAWSAVPLELQLLLEPKKTANLDPAAHLTAEADLKLNPPTPDLSVVNPLPLAELHAGLSGRVVGPKAANLGELARLFPGKVAPAVALPFGVFAAHAEKSRERLKAAFEKFRRNKLDDEGLKSETETVRKEIAELAVSAELRGKLSAILEKEFGAEWNGQGVFVRSDTNVEDLPGFTGAGLNETVPNVVGFDSQIAAIPRVWASPFTRRAMSWRERLLTRPEEVYPSVLLMKSVPSEKSGVLVTRDLVGRKEGLTVAVSWGVGGAVDNESAETLVLSPKGAVSRISGARAPYKRRLKEEGGVDWIPATMGAVLAETEIAALRALASEAVERVEPQSGPDGSPLPWDMEFGFVEGKLQLFQIRPLVERGRAAAEKAVAMLASKRQGLESGGSPGSQGLVNLKAPLPSTEGNIK